MLGNLFVNKSQVPVQSPPTTDTNDGMKRSSSEGTSLWAKFKRAGACISFPRSQTVSDKLANIAAVEDKEEEDASAKFDVKDNASGGAMGERVAFRKGETTTSGDAKVEMVTTGGEKGVKVASGGLKGETDASGDGLKGTIESGDLKVDTLASRDVEGRTVASFEGGGQTLRSTEETAASERAKETVVSEGVKEATVTSRDRDEIIASGGVKGQTFNGEKEEL